MLFLESMCTILPFLCIFFLVNDSWSFRSSLARKRVNLHREWQPEQDDATMSLRKHGSPLIDVSVVAVVCVLLEGCTGLFLYFILYSLLQPRAAAAVVADPIFAKNICQATLCCKNLVAFSQQYFLPSRYASKPRR
jgi:hypothetical protein